MIMMIMMIYTKYGIVEFLKNNHHHSDDFDISAKTHVKEMKMKYYKWQQSVPLEMNMIMMMKGPEMRL